MTRAIAQTVLLAMSTALLTSCQSAPSDCGPAPASPAAAPAATRVVSLSDTLAKGGLRTVNREVTALTGGNAVRVNAAPGIGLIWIDGTDFADGTIEVDVCGRDVNQESFLGIAFHRRNDLTYEAVYLRPFNFKSRSADRRQHAVQYVAMPDNDYSRLRNVFPGTFEQAVDPAVVPSGWNRLRLVVRSGRAQAFVGNGETAALDVRELQGERHGQIGLYLDNGSDGVFANLRILPLF